MPIYKGHCCIRQLTNFAASLPGGWRQRETALLLPRSLKRRNARVAYDKGGEALPPTGSIPSDRGTLIWDIIEPLENVYRVWYRSKRGNVCEFIRSDELTFEVIVTDKKGGCAFVEKLLRQGVKTIRLESEVTA